jgi:hypothetical protein
MTLEEERRIEYLFTTELQFECQWFVEAWDDLGKLLLLGNEPLRVSPITYNLKAWSFIDRMLVHAARIDRVLNPEHWGSKDSSESRAARKLFAKIVRDHLHPQDILSVAELKPLRDAIEHTNEKLYSFIGNRDINSLHPFVWGTDAIAKQAETVRGYDSYSRTGVVFGERLDLGRIHDAIRFLKFALPPLELKQEPPHV